MTRSGAAAPSAMDHDALQGYVETLFAGEDEVLREVRRRADAAGMPTIQLPAVTARAAQVLVRMVGARRVVEVGTLAGYSAIWLARALPPGGEVVTIEINGSHAAVAERSFAEAGVADRVRVVVGDAARVLPEMGPDGSFDVVFLDADKEQLGAYLEEGARLLRKGGLLLADNALWRGSVLDPGSDARGAHIHAFNERLAGDPRFDATILPVGDGLMVATLLRADAP